MDNCRILILSLPDVLSFNFDHLESHDGKIIENRFFYKFTFRFKEEMDSFKEILGRLINMHKIAGDMISEPDDSLLVGCFISFFADRIKTGDLDNISKYDTAKTPWKIEYKECVKQMLPETIGSLAELNLPKKELAKCDPETLVEDVKSFLRSYWTRVEFSQLKAIPRVDPKKPFELMRPYEGLICHVVDDSEDEDDDNEDK